MVDRFGGNFVAHMVGGPFDGLQETIWAERAGMTHIALESADGQVAIYRQKRRNSKRFVFDRYATAEDKAQIASGENISYDSKARRC